SAMLLQSFRKVLQTDPGFRPDHVFSFRLWLPETRYPKSDQINAFYESFLESVRALPGVRAAGAASALPIGEHSGYFAEVENGWEPGPNDRNPVVLEVVATRGYLETMGIALQAGRAFNDRDGESAGARVAIINETFAKQFWPKSEALGKRLR